MLTCGNVVDTERVTTKTRHDVSICARSIGLGVSYWEDILNHSESAKEIVADHRWDGRKEIFGATESRARQVRFLEKRFPGRPGGGHEKGGQLLTC
jgi:hypothetical protein